MIKKEMNYPRWEEGIIQEDGSILGDNGKEYYLPIRGTDEEGYPEVLIDAESIGLNGWMYRQSVKPMIEMKCKFIVYTPTSKSVSNVKII